MRNILTIVMLTFLWILMVGVYTFETLGLGFLISSISFVLFQRALSGKWIRQQKLFHQPLTTSSLSTYLTHWFSLIRFIPFFIGKIIVSGLQITKLSLTPGLSFWPCIVKIHGDLPNLNCVTGFANSITLTPGTFTLDYDQKSDLMFIHWIDISDYTQGTIDEHVTAGLRPWMKRIFS